MIRKVRVALFSTGDEPSCPVSRWATAKSTIPTVSPTPDVRTVGMRGNQLRDYPRRPHALRAAFIEADSQADLVIIPAVFQWVKRITPKRFLKSWGDRLLETGD